MTRLLALLAAVSVCGCSTESDQGGLRGSLLLTGSSTVAPLAAEIAQRFEQLHPQVRIDVQTGGSSQGIRDLLVGNADIAMASRALHPEESTLMTHPLALDGVCLIVHASNPVSSLDDEQVAAIYRGQLGDWQQVGGTAGAIVVTHKAAGRGTLEVFLQYFGLQAEEVQASLIVGDNQHTIKTVAGNPQALAYVSIGAAVAERERGAAIKLLAAGGVSPSSESVASGLFPICRRLYLLTAGAPQGLAREFLEFARSAAVADLVEGQTFVPIAH